MPKQLTWQKMIGEKYGLLTVVSFAYRKDPGKFYLQTKCECGNEKVVGQSELCQGKTTSCGCQRTAQRQKRWFKHGLKGTPEYNSWCAMKQRCYYISSSSYQNYGGRGIQVCDRWLSSFENFLSDMGEKPTPKHSIERIDNSRNYEPGNCRWATASEQSSNKRNNRHLSYDGKTAPLSVWAKDIGINESSLRERLKKWSLEDALTIPKLPNSKTLQNYKEKK